MLGEIRLAAHRRPPDEEVVGHVDGFLRFVRWQNTQRIKPLFLAWYHAQPGL